MDNDILEVLFGDSYKETHSKEDILTVKTLEQLEIEDIRYNRR